MKDLIVQIASSICIIIVAIYVIYTIRKLVENVMDRINNKQ